MREMGEKTRKTLESIRRQVRHAQETPFEVWANGADTVSLRQLWENTKAGIVYGHWDGRCLAALERRGLISYRDDMDYDCWFVVLNDC